jgi:hypothetical protein
MRSQQCQFLRTLDSFGKLDGFYFSIGMFHFNWYALQICFSLMWSFGFNDLSKRLKKEKSVNQDAKKFQPCDQFMYLIWTGNIV